MDRKCDLVSPHIQRNVTGTGESRLYLFGHLSLRFPGCASSNTTRRSSSGPCARPSLALPVQPRPLGQTRLQRRRQDRGGTRRPTQRRSSFLTRRCGKQEKAHTRVTVDGDSLERVGSSSASTSQRSRRGSQRRLSARIPASQKVLHAFEQAPPPPGIGPKALQRAARLPKLLLPEEGQ
ncbi:hypothetical protein SRHO_G00253510 [Serrasalmus rhombeus]